MRKTEFLQELAEALQGEISAAAIRENVNYYDQYISQEAAKGRSEEEVIAEIGSPRLIARTIIDSSEAGGGNDSGAGSERSGSYGNGGNYGNGNSGEYDPSKGDFGGSFHYINLNKWYWKLLLLVIVIAVIVIVFSVVGGIFSLLIRFAWPLFIIWIIYTIIRGKRR